MKRLYLLKPAVMTLFKYTTACGNDNVYVHPSLQSGHGLCMHTCGHDMVYVHPSIRPRHLSTPWHVVMTWVRTHQPVAMASLIYIPVCSVDKDYVQPL